MYNYVKYQIYLEEPLKMGKQGNQDNEESLSYIAGSTLRGAVIGKAINTWFENYIGDLSEEPLYSDILFKKTKFYDAYLAHEGKSLIPVPGVYYADKHDVRRAEHESEKTGSSQMTVHSCGILGEKPVQGEQRIDTGKFCLLKQDELRIKNVKKEANLHIALAQGEEKSKMFRYEAIAKGQTFVGLIQCRSEEDALKYKNLLENAVIYLGGSKGSGYGRCIITKAECISWESARQEFAGFNEQQNTNNALVIYALSNLILTDEWGKPTGRLSEKFLEERLGICNVQLKQAYLSTFRTSGFNHTWKARQIQQTAVSAGSVYLYTFDGTLDAEKVSKLEEDGIGVRKTEGFGRILINLPLGQKIKLQLEDEKDNFNLTPLTEKEKNAIELISAQIIEKREKEIIEMAANDTAQRNVGISAMFSITQISRLYFFLYEQQVMGKESIESQKEKIKFFLRKEIKSFTKEAYQNVTFIMGVDEKNRSNRANMETILTQMLDDTVSPDTWHTKLCMRTEELFEGIGGKERSPYEVKGEFLRAVLYNLMRMEGGSK